MGEITNEMIWQAIKELADQLQQTNGRVEQLTKQVQQMNEQVHRLSEQVSDMDQRLTDVANGQKILVEELFENKKEIKRVKTVLNLY
ncbi:hypothetical protein UM396_07630 [Geobacillus subterraneus]|uniref:MbeD/MobD family mobilization/exclusion protein n=1 Tax=Geobacillus subterraneus TaxID=129338 RepID=UPI002AC9119A|nr:MbeD/MobD family mobilization/exclusion protein [Geobacillus subterraneus]WPZ19758.1 hypothetical protein UM396_07630 [Geobacillus subterraneus]